MAADGTESGTRVSVSMDQQRAEAGLKLFKAEEELEFDTAAAKAHMDSVDAQIAEFDAEINLLTGKENKKARTAKEKEKKALKDAKEYIDACKVVKGVKPPNGNFLKKGAGPTKEEIEAEEARKKAAAEEEAKKQAEEEAVKAKSENAKSKKPTESAGISKAERDELEKLKNDIINKKKTLKEQGMSGGQMNKDPEIVEWVKRMNELKEKESPGSTASPSKEDKKKKKKSLSSEAQALLEEKEKAFEEYTERLRTEFKYSRKEINADPDFCEMKAEIEKLKK